LRSRSPGFISQDNGEANAFVHASNLVGVSEMKPGQIVEFEMAMGKRGKMLAVNVRIF
jgi:cold shock CspA family protein